MNRALPRRPAGCVLTDCVGRKTGGRLKSVMCCEKPFDLVYSTRVCVCVCVLSRFFSLCLCVCVCVYSYCCSMKTDSYSCNFVPKLFFQCMCAMAISGPTSLILIPIYFNGNCCRSYPPFQREKGKGKELSAHSAKESIFENALGRQNNS